MYEYKPGMKAQWGPSQIVVGVILVAPQISTQFLVMSTASTSYALTHNYLSLFCIIELDASGKKRVKRN